MSAEHPSDPWTTEARVKNVYCLQFTSTDDRLTILMSPIANLSVLEHLQAVLRLVCNLGEDPFSLKEASLHPDLSLGCTSVGMVAPARLSFSNSLSLQQDSPRAFYAVCHPCLIWEGRQITHTVIQGIIELLI